MSTRDANLSIRLEGGKERESGGREKKWRKTQNFSSIGSLNRLAILTDGLSPFAHPVVVQQEKNIPGVLTKKNKVQLILWFRERKKVIEQVDSMNQFFCTACGYCIEMQFYAVCTRRSARCNKASLTSHPRFDVSTREGGGWGRKYSKTLILVHHLDIPTGHSNSQILLGKPPWRPDGTFQTHKFLETCRRTRSAKCHFLGREKMTKSPARILVDPLKNFTTNIYVLVHLCTSMHIHVHLCTFMYIYVHLCTSMYI